MHASQLDVQVLDRITEVIPYPHVQVAYQAEL